MSGPDPPASPRYFVGIFPPRSVRDRLANDADTLEGRLTDARLRKTLASDIHLTLRYVGEFPAERLGELTDALRGAVRDLAPFDVRPRGIGGFPSDRRARIVWAGVDESSTEPLTELVSEVEEAFVGLGLERERRPYRPHFTLARSRSPVSLKRTDFKLEEFDAFEVRSVVLACNPAPGSRRTKDTPIYEKVEEFPLSG